MLEFVAAVNKVFLERRGVDCGVPDVLEAGEERLVFAKGEARPGDSTKAEAEAEPEPTLRFLRGEGVTGSSEVAVVVLGRRVRLSGDGVFGLLAGGAITQRLGVCVFGVRAWLVVEGDNKSLFWEAFVGEEATLLAVTRETKSLVLLFAEVVSLSLLEATLGSVVTTGVDDGLMVGEGVLSAGAEVSIGSDMVGGVRQSEDYLDEVC